MSDREIKMIALDLDGTTLNHRKEITPRTVADFAEAMARGIHVVVSTGRTFHSLPAQIHHIDGLEYVVTSNGAHITELSTGRTIYEDHIGAPAVETIVEVLRESGCSVETFVQGRAYIDQEEYEAIVSGKVPCRDAEYVKTTRNPIPHLFSFMQEHKTQIENISLNFFCDGDKQNWLKTLGQLEGITLTSSFACNIEIGGRGTSKGAALRFLMEKLQITPDQLMACGDSLNDLEMIKLAGTGVAMGNACEEVKTQADVVTDTNDRDGVAKAIERYALGK